MCVFEGVCGLYERKTEKESERGSENKGREKGNGEKSLCFRSGKSADPYV